MENELNQSIIPDAMQEDQIDVEEECRLRLDKLNKQARARRIKETNEHRSIRLKKQNHYTQLRRAIETEEEYLKRLKSNNEQTQTSRDNETEEKREKRLKENNERTQTSRDNETKDKREKRLGEQRERSETVRENNTSKKCALGDIAVQGQNIDTQLNETENDAYHKNDSTDTVIQNETVTNRKKILNSLPWPEPISRGLKEPCLQQFLEQMSMSVLAEATCTACNIRTSVQKIKKIPISKIPHFDLLKVPKELKDLILNTRSLAKRNLNNNSAPMMESIQSNI